MLLEATTARGRTCLLPASVVLEAVAAAARPGLALDELLASRPMLLTAALIAFHDVKLRPAGSPGELAEWLKQAWLTAMMAGRPIGGGQVQLTWLRASRRASHRHKPASADDSASHKADVVCKTLRRCVSVTAPGNDKRARREMVPAVLSDRFARLLVAAGEACGPMPFWLASELLLADGADCAVWQQACAALAGQATAEAVFAERLLDEKLASLRQFAYGASHEINNPLANISMRAEALQRGETDEVRLRSLRTIHQQAMRAHHMITDLMLFAHPPALRRQEVLPSAVAAQVLGEVLARHPQREFTAVLEQPAAPRTWSLDPGQFAELVLALVNNAVEALASAGEIRLQVDESAGQFLAVRCHDSGPGFDDRVARHLFDPFFSGREAGRGLGFGLSRAWTIAQSHGGSLRVLDRSAGRTCFEARFPRAAAGSFPACSSAAPDATRQAEAA